MTGKIYIKPLNLLKIIPFSCVRVNKLMIGGFSVSSGLNKVNLSHISISIELVIVKQIFGYRNWGCLLTKFPFLSILELTNLLLVRNIAWSWAFEVVELNC